MFKDKKDNIFILGRFLSFKLFYLMFRLDHEKRIFHQSDSSTDYKKG